LWAAFLFADRGMICVESVELSSVLYNTIYMAVPYFSKDHV